MHESHELNDLERALTALTPAPAKVNREQVYFRAGQASALRRARLWQATSAVLALAAAGVGVAWATRETSEPEVRIVRVIVPQDRPVEPAPKPETPDAPQTVPVDAPFVVGTSPVVAYLQLQQHVLRWGVEDLPAPASAGHAPARLSREFEWLRPSLPVKARLVQ